MIASPHMALGALIAKETGNWALAGIMGILSHILLDLIPHPKFNLPKISFRTLPKFFLLAIDMAVGLFVALLIVGKNFNSTTLGFGIGGAVLLDIIYELPSLNINLKIFKGLDKFHFDIQNENIPLSLGIISQVLVLLICVLLSQLL